MITRPLDLASRLRSVPRNLDTLFYVNVGVIVLAFSVFGSRFVLAPGLGLEFQLPEMAGARAEATKTTHNIAVNDVGLIIAKEGSITLKRLGEWLQEEARTTKEPVLLVRAEVGVKTSQLTKIAELAQAAGFRAVILGAQEPGATSDRR